MTACGARASVEAAVAFSIALSLPRRRLAALALEFAERAVIIVLYAGLTRRLLDSYLATHNPAGLLALASEGLVLFLAFVRRPAQTISFRVQDWALALGASCLPLMLTAPPGVTALGPSWIGWSFQTAGFIGQAAAKLFLFRNFGIAPAVRGVSERGPYRWVRHPMYASYFLCQVGFIYAFPTWWNAALIALWSIGQVLRILVEERLLQTEPAYRAYAARVRWRLLPGAF